MLPVAPELGGMLADVRNRRLFPIGAVFAMLASCLTACSLPQLEDYDPLPLAQTSFLYASDGSLITELHATEDRVVLRRNQMSPFVRDAVVAIEDRRFFYHHGFDGRAIIRAAYVNAAEGEVVEGGSTITQQLVKILYVGSADTKLYAVNAATGEQVWAYSASAPVHSPAVTQDTVYFGSDDSTLYAVRI